MQWPNQDLNINTDIKVEVWFTLPALSAKNAVTWRYYVDESAKILYGMILGRYLLKQLVLNLKLSDHIIEAYYGSFKGYTTSMIDLSAF